MKVTSYLDQLLQFSKTVVILKGERNAKVLLSIPSHRIANLSVGILHF